MFHADLLVVNNETRSVDSIVPWKGQFRKIHWPLDFSERRGIEPIMNLFTTNEKNLVFIAFIEVKN